MNRRVRRPPDKRAMERTRNLACEQGGDGRDALIMTARRHCKGRLPSARGEHDVAHQMNRPRARHRICRALLRPWNEHETGLELVETNAELSSALERMHDADAVSVRASPRRRSSPK